MAATNTKPAKLTGTITAFRVVKEDAEKTQANPTTKPNEVDPRTKRIDKRPPGYLPSHTCKMEYTCDNERDVLYFTVSFLRVEGVVEGRPVTIERPIEAFIPPGQRTADHEWIAALMRNLSLNARNGILPEALADMRKVVGNRGVVMLHCTPTGKERFHDSVVAAFASMVQGLLRQTGFLDEADRLNPLEAMLAKPAQAPIANVVATEPVETEAQSPVAEASEETPFGRCQEKLADNSRCHGALYKADGCLVCPDCGFSKCQ
jgi:ribonucleoside-diphosphate reductase alpha chain